MLDRPRPAFTGLVIKARSFGPTTEQEARRIGFGRDTPADPPSVVNTDPPDRLSDDHANRVTPLSGTPLL